MSNPPTVIVDADAIIAQADQNDNHHKTASVISGALAQMNARVILLR